MRVVLFKYNCTDLMKNAIILETTGDHIRVGNEIQFDLKPTQYFENMI